MQGTAWGILSVMLVLAWNVSWAAAGCASPEPVPAGPLPPRIAAPPLPPPRAEPGPIAAEPQRAGDPEAGYRTLVNYGYVTCGIPDSAYSQVFGPAPAAYRLPGREGRNQTLPYLFTAHETDSGVTVIATNCLTCHAGFLNGELIVGLGDPAPDFTTNYAGPAMLARGLVADEENEIAEWRRFYQRVRAVAPFVTLDTVGVNPADNLAWALMAHRDRETLAWLEDPQFEIPDILVPVDVPPWWRMAKKNAMFYNGAGRGDHARLMMAAATLCTDGLEEARRIDEVFDDVAAYIRTIEPPVWPYPVDHALADEGRSLFDDQCADCHGTYGEPAAETYPNLLVSLDEVGTDRILATGAAFYTRDVLEWWEASFWGETTRLEPGAGYMAPPLDGIWATAPYLHNGSVPTLAALLESGQRPTYWTRTFESNDYDADAVGWRFTALDHGKDAETDYRARLRLYDTTGLGYGNGGHTFGDDLTPAERRALLEYLKTI